MRARVPAPVRAPEALAVLELGAGALEREHRLRERMPEPEPVGVVGREQPFAPCRAGEREAPAGTAGLRREPVELLARVGNRARLETGKGALTIAH